MVYDYTQLEKALKRAKMHKMSDVKDQIVKVAFDVVRFVDSQNIDDLWQIQHCEDGDYIVAMYDEPELKVTASLASPWTALADSGNVHVFYKGTPITKIALESLGLPADDASLVKSYLPQKLAENKTLAKNLLNQLSQDHKAELYSKFPELA